MDPPSIIQLAKNGDVEQLKEQLLGEVDLNLRDELYGQTALSWASENGHLEVVKVLLEKDAKTDIADGGGLLPLYWACSNEHNEIAKLLLKSTTKPQDILHRDGYGRSALSYAAMCGAADVIPRLLSTPDIEIDSRDEEGLTPLMFAVSHGHEEVSRLLLNANADPFLKDEEGRAALYHAASKGHVATMRILLKTNPDLIRFNGPKSEDPEMMVAATFAVAASGIDGTWKALPSRSQYLAAQDSAGFTALHHAANLGFLDAARRLFQDGSKVNALHGTGKSPLILASISGSLPTVEFLLEQGADLNLRDGTYKQTPLMFAVEYGREDVVQYLCARHDVDINAIATGWSEYTASKRTPLFWAVVSGSEKCVSLLLKRGADPDHADNNRRTPLSWAAGKGHLSVVKQLLAYRVDEETPVSTKTRDGSKAMPEPVLNKESRSAQEAAIRSTVKTAKGKAKAIEVNSLDSKLWTPLFHAAYNGHNDVIDILLSHGADLSITFMGGSGNVTIVEHIIHLKKSLQKDAATASAPPVQNSKPELAALDAVLQLLISAESLRKEPLKEAAMVERQFLATVVRIPKRDDSYMAMKMLPVDALLRQGLPKHLLGDDSCRWLHLPANNMTWVEVLMARHFESAGEKEEWKRNLVLKRKVWSGQQHSSWDRTYHARFMRPACHSFNLSQSTANAYSSPLEPHSKGAVIFMPFLHWDVEDEIEKLKKIMKKKHSLRKNPETTKAQHIEEIIEEGGLNETEKLYWIYLDKKSPLHVRRTLDQFYYHTLPNTDERDKDQTALRHFRDQEFLGTDFRPVLTMVDQLWMWILPEIGRSPPTVITAFPQRCDRMTLPMSNSMTVLIANIIERAQELAVRTNGELAEVIASECSRIYLDATSDRKQPIQFLEIYNTSIGEITDRETKRFRAFQDAIKPIKPKEAKGVKNPQDHNPEALKKMIDIESDIEDLRRIKDIREELGMMSSLFHVQKEVLQVMDLAIRDAHRHPRLLPESSTPTPTLSTFGSPEVDAKERAPESLMLMTVNRNIETVQRLEEYAERAITAIQQLLDLKHKQATLLQEQLARELTIQTGKQGNTIMWFTVATIVFLPLSFMASFLALEVSEFPWSNDKLSLSFVLKILFTVSVAVCVPAVTLAFHLNKVKAALGYLRNTAGVEYVSQIVMAIREICNRILDGIKDARSRGDEERWERRREADIEELRR